jgi:outer membrane biosynthesis protein TonB
MPAGELAAWFGALGLVVPVAIMHGRSSRFAGKAPPPAPESFPHGFAKGAFRAGPGLCEPRLRRAVEPRFPPEVRDIAVPGHAEVLAIVQPDGSITARVLSAPEPRDLFEREALSAAARHVFDPGSKDGVPVPIVVTLILEFSPPSTPRPGMRIIGGTADPPAAPGSRLADAAERPGPGLVRPLPIRKVYPPCPPSLRASRASGRLEMLAVLSAGGTVDDLEVTHAFDPDSGFDDAAASSVKEWVFEPAMKDGVAVPMLVAVFICVDRQE